MLTNDLMRVRIHKEIVRPQFLDTSDEVAQSKAHHLVELFEGHMDQTRESLERKVDEAIGYGTDFVIWRGLAKLLYDRTDFETVAQADPVDIRRAVFEASSAHGPVVDADSRARVLEHAARALEIEPEACEQGLYADLRASQRMTAYKPIDPMGLLNRYNLALAQAVLYRATSLSILLKDHDPNHLRYLFQALKFHGLMHRAWKVEGGYQLQIDGPASLFSQSRKYGLQMAKFLPALVLMDNWSLTAQLTWERDKYYTMELTPESGLVSHYQARGQWVSDVEEQFEARFERLKAKALKVNKKTGKPKEPWPWSLQRKASILELDEGQVLIPDYVLSHDSGQDICIEIVGFWRKAYLQRRLQWLTQHTDPPLILVVGQQLRADKEALDALPSRVVFFKSVVLVKQVLEQAQHIIDHGVEG